MQVDAFLQQFDVSTEGLKLVSLRWPADYELVVRLHGPAFWLGFEPNEAALEIRCVGVRHAVLRVDAQPERPELRVLQQDPRLWAHRGRHATVFLNRAVRRPLELLGRFYAEVASLYEEVPPLEYEPVVAGVTPTAIFSGAMELAQKVAQLVQELGGESSVIPGPEQVPAARLVEISPEAWVICADAFVEWTEGRG